MDQPDDRTAAPDGGPALEQTIRQTYFGLRLGMIVLAGMLFVSTAIQAVLADCLQDSISAYYYTPARPMLIAALCALGAALIIYKGNTGVENTVLDVAGFLAFVVAFVPTVYLPDARGCPPTNLPTTADIAAAITNNVLTLLVAGFVAVGLAQLLRPRGGGPARLVSGSRGVSIAIAFGLLVLGTVYFNLDTAGFVATMHLRSAAGLFVLILVVMGLNARHAPAPYSRIYAAILVVTLLIALPLFGLGVTGHGFRTWLLVVESTCILGFMAFWIVQTRELGGFVDRSHRARAATSTD